MQKFGESLQLRVTLTVKSVVALDVFKSISSFVLSQALQLQEDDLGGYKFGVLVVVGLHVFSVMSDLTDALVVFNCQVI